MQTLTSEEAGAGHISEMARKFQIAQVPLAERPKYVPPHLRAGVPAPKGSKVHARTDL